MALDILYNTDGTIKEKDGDFDFGVADQFLMEDILLASPGHYKEFPVLGANVERYVNARVNVQTISRNIITALRVDIFKNPTVDLSRFPIMVINDVELEV